MEGIELAKPFQHSSYFVLFNYGTLETFRKTTSPSEIISHKIEETHTENWHLANKYLNKRVKKEYADTGN